MASLKEPIVLPHPEDPFHCCKLGRKKYATILTNLVTNYSDGFVLAINNKWGTGKTTFVKMWQQHIELGEQASTIYFNAWENDFEDNPLTALMGELKVWSGAGKSEEPYKSLLQHAAALSKEIAPAIVKAVAEKYIDTQVLTDVLEAATKGASDIFVREVDEYSKKKDSIAQFRKKLADFINTKNGSKPLVFIIDELDRCRPNYAVAILEQIKHFFSIKNMIFVLSIDKEQLGHAVRGVYGSDRIDADEYLRRFVDIEFSLPDPTEGKFLDFLYQYYEFDSIFSSSFRKNNADFDHDPSAFLSSCKVFFRDFSLRKQQKLMASLKIILTGFSHQERILPKILVFLAYIKSEHVLYYNDIKTRRLEISDLHKKFYEVVDQFIKVDDAYFLLSIEGYLLNFYGNSLDLDIRGNKIFTLDPSEQKYQLQVTSRIDDKRLFDFFNSLSRDPSVFHRKIDFYLKKIDLIDNFKL